MPDMRSQNAVWHIGDRFLARNPTFLVTHDSRDVGGCRVPVAGPDGQVVHSTTQATPYEDEEAEHDLNPGPWQQI